jgi:hypothetical protein
MTTKVDVAIIVQEYRRSGTRKEKALFWLGYRKAYSDRLEEFTAVGEACVNWRVTFVLIGLQSVEGPVTP